MQKYCKRSKNTASDQKLLQAIKNYCKRSKTTASDQKLLQAIRNYCKRSKTGRWKGLGTRLHPGYTSIASFTSLDSIETGKCGSDLQGDSIGASGAHCNVTRPAKLTSCFPCFVTITKPRPLRCARRLLSPEPQRESLSTTPGYEHEGQRLVYV